jgi:hypothetical protein
MSAILFMRMEKPRSADAGRKRAKALFEQFFGLLA